MNTSVYPRIFAIFASVFSKICHIDHYDSIGKNFDLLE